jgi:hypothetical protein
MYSILGCPIITIIIIIIIALHWSAAFSWTIRRLFFLLMVSRGDTHGLTTFSFVHHTAALPVISYIGMGIT